MHYSPVEGACPEFYDILSRRAKEGRPLLMCGNPPPSLANSLSTEMAVRGMGPFKIIQLVELTKFPTENDS